MPDEVIELLRDLIAIESVNLSLVADGKGEEEITAAIVEEMRAGGMDVGVSEAAPNRPNMVGVIEGRRPGRTLMLCGHVHTVGVECMKSPFDPVVDNGRIYGLTGQEGWRGGYDRRGAKNHVSIRSNERRWEFLLGILPRKPRKYRCIGPSSQQFQAGRP